MEKFKVFNATEKWAKSLAKARAIDKGEVKPKVPEPRHDVVIKHYTIYAKLAGKEKPIAWRTLASDFDRITQTHRRKIMRFAETIVEGDPLFEVTEYEAREERG